MKKLISILIIISLLTSCTTSDTQYSPGVIAPCDQLQLLKAADKTLTMPCLDGVGEINLYQVKGPILINVWGSWCEGCRDEMPYLVELYKDRLFQSGQIKLLGVNVEEASIEAAVNYIENNGMSWPHLLDTDGRSKSFFGIGVPVTWFVDDQGLVVDKKIGSYTSREQLFTQVEKAFGIKL